MAKGDYTPHSAPGLFVEDPSAVIAEAGVMLLGVED